MNFVGKILIMLILVMSFVFMGFAVAVYATHTNWRDKVLGSANAPSADEKSGLKKVLADKKAENAELQAALEKLKAEKDAEIKDKAESLVKLETEKKALQSERDDLTKQRDELSKKEKAAVAALDSSSKNLEKLTAEVGKIRQEIRVAQDDRDKQFAQVVKLTDQVHQREGEVVRLTERSKQLTQDITKARALLAKHGEDVNSPLDKTPPQLFGKVLAINDEKMVEVSVGSDDGLRVGHTMEVYRGDKYIGRVVILTTNTDRSVAKILPDYTKTPIQKGDNVATRLKVG